MSELPPNVTVFIVVMISLCAIYIVLHERQFNLKILRQESFYRGTQKGAGKKCSFWLPLFLYRRRRRTSGKNSATIKNMQQL